MEDLKMVDYYRAKCITYVNGKEKSVYSFCGLFTEEQVQNNNIKITWENLDKVYYKWGLILPFNYFQFKHHPSFRMTFSKKEKNQPDYF